MRHIKFKAVPVAPDFQKVEVTILEQTHHNYDFIRFRAKNGFTLDSAAFPEVRVSEDKVFLQGHLTSHHNDVLTMYTAFYQKFKAAVEEYNEFYKAKAPVVEACAVIVG